MRTIVFRRKEFNKKLFDTSKGLSVPKAFFIPCAVQLQKQHFLATTLSELYLNSKEIHEKLVETINMKYLCIKTTFISMQKDTFHNIEHSVCGITISSSRAYFRIQRKRQICSKRASYFGNKLDLIFEN